MFCVLGLKRGTDEHVLQLNGHRYEVGAFKLAADKLARIECTATQIRGVELRKTKITIHKMFFDGNQTLKLVISKRCPVQITLDGVINAYASTSWA